MKWCNPCALVWVVIGSAFASHVWLHVDWTYSIAAVLVLLPTIAVIFREEREDIWWVASSLIAEIWWLFRNKPPRRSTSQLKKEPQ